MNLPNPLMLTPGVLISIHELIYYVSTHGALAAGDAHALVSNSPLLGGGLPVSEGINAGLRFGFLEMAGGELSLSEYSATRIVPHCTSDEPQLPAMRAILLKVAISRVPHWIAFYIQDRDAFRAAIPDVWIELLDQAELFDFADEVVLAWWREILFEHHKSEEKRLKEIGDVGEKLTVQSERNRLVSEHHPIDPNMAVIWVARLSSEFGYDVKSSKGAKFGNSTTRLDAIAIEVKSSVTADHTIFRFRLSRNEWNTALPDLTTYYFYCWAGVSLSTQSASAGPFVIPASAFVDLVPQNQSDVCEWTECAFTINLEEYAQQ